MESHSTSLPSHFRYHPSPRSPFFTAEPDDPARTVPSVDLCSAKTRLEVLKGWEVNFSVLCLYLASFVALVYVFIKLRFAASEWHQSRSFPYLTTPEYALLLLLQAASIAIPLIYLVSLYIAPTITDEQTWTAIVLTVALLASNPLTRVNSLTKHALDYSDQAAGRVRVLFFPLDLLSSSPTTRLVVSDAAYTAAIYLYLILSAHSYRVFDIRSLRTFAFYGPKLIVATFFFLVKLVAGFKAGVSLGLVPYSRLLTWFILYRGNRHSLRVTIPVIVTTILDTAFAFWLVTEVARTAEFLAMVPYVENRSKQLGFRCYVFQTLAFCGNMIGLSVLTTYMLPVSYIYHAYDNAPHDFLQMEPPNARLGLALIYCTWTLVISYVNLPPDPIIPFARRLMQRSLFLVRHCRVAAWLGLAHIVTAEEPADDDQLVNDQEETRPDADTLLMRYRHREMFDSIIVSSNRMNSTGLSHPRTFPTPAMGYMDIFKPFHSWYDEFQSEKSFSFNISPPVSFSAPDSFGHEIPRNSSELQSDQNPSVDEEEVIRPRLRLRKNIFVMETQVLLMNATYLSYIPGNPNEESAECSQNPALQHISSLPDVLEELARSQSRHHASSPSNASENPQPANDDGTMFPVNPYEMAEKHGYKIYKHFSDETLNTHAIILVNSTRVVVAFSGTRNVTNWSLNANVKRAVLDDKLSRFEYELSDIIAPKANSDSGSDEPVFGLFGDHGWEINLDRTEFAEQDQVRRSKSEGVNLGTRSSPVGTSECLSKPVKTYGAISHLDDIERDRRPSAPGPPVLGSRTQQGVSMMASTLANELMTFGQAKVHEGFINAYMSLRKQIMGSLIELYRGRGNAYMQQIPGSPTTSRGGIAKSLPLFFCGHSLGGAIATFASYEAARYYKRIGLDRRQDVSCTTFGCPRLGNEAFKARYENLVETHWRFEIASDPVPKFPSFALNYVPVGVQVLIDQSGMLLIDPSFIEVQWWGQLSSLYMGYRLHIRASYCMALRTYCKIYRGGSDDLSDKFWPFPLLVQTKGLFRQLYK